MSIGGLSAPKGIYIYGKDLYGKRMLKSQKQIRKPNLNRRGFPQPKILGFGALIEDDFRPTLQL